MIHSHLQVIRAELVKSYAKSSYKLRQINLDYIPYQTQYQGINELVCVTAVLHAMCDIVLASPYIWQKNQLLMRIFKTFYDRYYILSPKVATVPYFP